ncbi:MAG: hypothetical protein IJ060_09335 [Oscillospiraceae bacterium]|nr:hypothetical protein [Oscillospiraceae bacterium]
MAITTAKYELKLPEGMTEFFDPNRYIGNMYKLEAAVKGDGIEHIRRMSKEEYDVLVPSEDTLYFVTDDKGHITQYIGSTELSSGQGSPFAYSDVQAVTPGGVSEDIIAIAEEVI